MSSHPIDTSPLTKQVAVAPVQAATALGAVPAPPPDAHQEPLIIDLAQLSYSELKQQHPSLGNPGFYVWLHFIRPAVVAAVWILAGLHLWRFFVTQAPAHGTILLVVLGTMAVTALFILARQQPRHSSPATQQRVASAATATEVNAGTTTLPEIAAYADLPRDQLAHWQRSRQLRVRHNESGRLIQAIDVPLKTA